MDQEAFEERAAIMEFDGGLSRREAEARARDILCPVPVSKKPGRGKGYAAFQRYVRHNQGGSNNGN